MKTSWSRMCRVLGLAALLIVAFAPAAVNAQFGGGGFGGGGGGFGGGGGGFGGGQGGFGGGGGQGGFGGQQGAGVVIDANGVLKMKIARDPGGLNAKKITMQAMARLDPKLAQQSKLRKISLNRLEKAVAAQLAKGEPLPDEMKYLAGLLRVQNVFFYPATGDIVLAGPAEGFAEDPVGRVRGLGTGRPVVELQDVVTALRAYSPSGRKVGMIGVSIDPTEEGLANLQNFIKKNSRILFQNPNAQTIRQFAAGMRQQLGLQTVSVMGIAPETHFAQVLVEADYRMKLIGIGLEKPPVDISSFIAVAKPNALAGNSLVRWYFVPDYKCVRVSEDGQAMEMEGWGVKLVGAQELVDQAGGRTKGNRESLASKKFCLSFTKNYPALANREPIYAQLRNMIDVAVAAAFIQKQDYYGQSGWDLGVFGDESKYSIETCDVPKFVESAVNAVFKGNALLTPIGGGVTVYPQRALEQENLLSDEEGKVSAAQKGISLKDLPESQWWWD